MSKTCNNCGNIMDDDANICSRCGTQYIALQSAQPAADAGGYQQQPQQPQQMPAYQQQYQQYQQPYGQGYQQGYQQPYQQYAAVEKPMGVGSWVGTILLTTCLGLVSLILLFVWGFGNDVPIAKKNYCRAMLIVELIAVGVSILFLIIFAVIFASSWDSIVNNFSYYINY